MQLPDFTKASVLIIGDIMLDRYWFGDTGRISPEAPVPIVKIKQTDERPGGAANVALNVAALGVKTTLIGVTGNDSAAKTLEAQLTAANVTPVFEYSDIPTITKLRVISRHQQLIRLDFEEKFPARSPAKLLDLYRTHLTKADIVILSDYNKGTLQCSQDIIRLANEAGVPVLVDPKGNDFTIYNGADIITPNLKEFELIMGACETEHDIAEKAQLFLQKHHIDSLLLTRGERGMTFIQRHAEEIHLPAHAREVFDVTGAGDTVIGVLAAALAAGESKYQAIKLANLAASLVVAKLGAACVSAPELQMALMQSESTSISGILNEEQLLQAVTEARLRGKKIVFTNGCFDILHAGHVTYLQQAKQLGDYLIVAINDDQSVKRLKGPSRPINNTEQRMAVLASLGVVDWVTHFTDDTPERLLKSLQPDILVKGGDYTLDQVVGADIVRTYGGQIRVLSLVKNLSTSSIIERMVKNQHSIHEEE